MTRPRIAGGVALTLLCLGIADGPRPSTVFAQGAQAPPSSKGVVRKGKAPVSDQALRITLPRPQEVDLANGLRLMVLEDRRVPQVTFGIVIPGAGGYFNPTDKPGVAGFAAQMLREGTRTRSASDLAMQLETMSASLVANTSPSSPIAFISGQSLTENFSHLLDITADVLLNPAFADDEVTRLKQRMRAQMIQQRSVPAFLSNELYARVIYGTHPAGRISPTVEAIDRMTRADLEAFHNATYHPDHALVAISGDISLAEARSLVESRFAAWKKAGTPPPHVANPPAPPGSAVHLVMRPNSVQTSFIVGAQAIDRSDPDYEIASVMNRIVGGGATGRLFLSLREDKGYTYGAYSNLIAGPYRGDWRASTDVRADVTAPALRDLLAEITRIRDEPVPAEELRDAQRSMVASFALSLEAPEQIIQYAIQSWQYKLAPDYWDRYSDRIMAITPAQVQAAARKYLEPGRLHIVAVGSPATADVLRKYGTLATYDTEGKKLE